MNYNISGIARGEITTADLSAFATNLDLNGPHRTYTRVAVGEGGSLTCNPSQRHEKQDCHQ
jgi:hypothetical protein